MPSTRRLVVIVVLTWVGGFLHGLLIGHSWSEDRHRPQVRQLLQCERALGQHREEKGVFCFSPSHRDR